METEYLASTHLLEAEEAGEMIAQFSGENNQTAADAFQIWLNGKQIIKKRHTNTYLTAEYMNLSLQKGQNI